MINPIGLGGIAQQNHQPMAVNGISQQIATEQQEQQQQSVVPTQEADGFAPTGQQQQNQFRPDLERVAQMRAELNNNMSAFRTMVQGLINWQSNDGNGGILDLLGGAGVPGIGQNGDGQWVINITPELQAAAQAAIAEDGEWGVNAVSDRILDFAMALTGGDPSRIGLMRDAFEAGFAAAERAWGGNLPEISHQTRERVLEGFRAWEETANAGIPGQEEAVD